MPFLSLFSVWLPSIMSHMPFHLLPQILFPNFGSNVGICSVSTVPWPSFHLFHYHYFHLFAWFHCLFYFSMPWSFFFLVFFYFALFVLFSFLIYFPTFFPFCPAFGSFLRFLYLFFLSTHLFADLPLPASWFFIFFCFFHFSLFFSPKLFLPFFIVFQIL